MRLEDYLIQHAALAFDRQLSIADQVGDWRWDVDTHAGEIVFSKKKLFGSKERRSPIQVLGSESEETETWLWAWANGASGLPDKVLQGAHALRVRGESERIPQWMVSQFELERTDGHTLSLIAVGVLDKPGYWRCEYEGGAAFVLLEDPSFLCEPERPAMRISEVFPQLLTTYAISDHRSALAAYLRACRFSISEEGARLTAKSPKGSDGLTAIFDEEGRLLELGLEMR